MRVRSLWLLGIILLALLSGVACEDDPTDLQTTAGTGGAPAAGKGAGTSAAGTGGGSSAAAGTAAAGSGGEAGH